jgi:hypothetical protein
MTLANLGNNLRVLSILICGFVKLAFLWFAVKGTQ